MKMVRAACLIAVLLVLAGRTLPAQEPLFGSDPMPRSATEAHSFSLVKGVWNVPVSRKGTTRLIQIVGLGPEKNLKAELACSSDVKPMQNMDWVLAKGDCLLRFKPDGDVGSQPVRLTVLAAALQSSKIASIEDQARADQNTVKVMIALEGGHSTASGPESSAKSNQSLADWFRPALEIFCLILVVAIMAILFIRYRRSRRSTTDETAKDDFAEQEMRNAPPLMRPPLQSLGKTPIQEVLRQQTAPRPVEPVVQETAIEKTVQAHSKLLGDLSSKEQNLEIRIQELADRFISLIHQSSREAEDRQSDIRSDTNRRLLELDNRITATQGKLSEHLASQSSRLQDLFKDLPALAELSTTSQSISKSDLARLEENLVSAAKKSALSNERLEPLQDESSALLDAIQEFIHIAENTSKDRTKKRLARVIETATVINDELFSLGQLAATQKHGFFVQMSLLEQNPLAQDLAAALTRETMKLADPEGYYQKRLEALRAQACVAGIDLADLDVDAERRNSGLQQALAKLIQTLGMTTIDPGQNDKLQAADHQVVQFVRRVPGVQPGAIAHTMTRGLHRRGEVVRKASVLLYE